MPVVILKSRISAGKAGDMTVWLSSAMNEPTTITPTMMNRVCGSIGFAELAADRIPRFSVRSQHFLLLVTACVGDPAPYLCQDAGTLMSPG